MIFDGANKVLRAGVMLKILYAYIVLKQINITHLLGGKIGAL